MGVDIKAPEGLKMCVISNEFRFCFVCSDVKWCPRSEQIHTGNGYFSQVMNHVTGVRLARPQLGIP